MSVSDTYKVYDKNIEIILKVNYDKKEAVFPWRMHDCRD